jgi:O-antigen/teichoic acid export membrane protein
MRKKQSRTQNTLYNLISGIGGEFIVYLLSFITRTVFIKTLGRSYLGIGGLFTNILSLLSLTDMGVGMALNYRFYKPLKENNQKRIQVLLKFYKQMYTMIGAVILVLGLCLIPFLKYLIKDYQTFDSLGIKAGFVFLLYLMQSVSTYWFFAYKSAIIKADQKEYYINILGYGLTLATNILQIVVLLITNNYLVYISVVILMNIATGLINAKLADRMYPYIKEKVQESISKEERNEIFKDCGSIFIFSVNSVILKATDNLVLSTFIGLDIVGLYSNYLMIYNALKKIIKKFIRAAQPSIGNLFSTADNSEKYEFFQLMNYLMFISCGTASVCVAVLSDEFIRAWLGEEYVIAMPFSILIGVELYMVGATQVMAQMRDVIGLFQKMKWSPVIGAVLNIVISIGLVQQIGIYGVLLGTIISQLLSAFAIYPYAICKYGFKNTKYVADYYVTSMCFVAELVVAGLACWYMNQNIFVGHGMGSFIFHSVLTGATTVCMIMLFNLKNKVFRKIIVRVFNNIKSIIA